MLTMGIRLKNLAFLAIGAVVLAFIGVRYAELGPLVGFRDHYVVRVQLAETGGLFTHSNVTYRGVSVGRVGPVELTDDGVEAQLRIKDSAPAIPADLEAHVANLSAVGEQYVDLRPRRDDGPRLKDGSVIRAAHTRTPAPVTRVLGSVDSMAKSVPTESLRIVVDEFGKAFQGHGDDLEALVESGSAFIEAADKSLPATNRLIQDSETVLRTQAEEAKALRKFATGAADLAEALKGSDTDLRRIIAQAPGAVTQVSALLKDLDPQISVLIANLLTTSEIAVTRQRGTEEFLVKVPAVAAAGASTVSGRGITMGMAVTFFEPLPCTAGYGGTRYRNGLDLGTPPPLNTRARCAASPGSGVNVRGSANAPRGGAVPEPARPGSRGGASGGGNGMPGALGLPGVDTPEGGVSTLLGGRS
ncbi:MCE family protein [Streptomyces monticola]|uniref:MCE family protein n=1 Tax=Streptomyces monticola TaxID=2666263 RepID=A0ABW2JC04_9ACTN